MVLAALLALVAAFFARRAHALVQDERRQAQERHEKLLAKLELGMMLSQKQRQQLADLIKREFAELRGGEPVRAKEDDPAKARDWEALERRVREALAPDPMDQEIRRQKPTAEEPEKLLPAEKHVPEPETRKPEAERRPQPETSQPPIVRFEPRPQPEREPGPRSKVARDWEKFIGENLINKIGILILVAGISFFVRYAIGQGWIGEVARVGIGFLAGGALVALAHRLRQNFAAFGSVLVGGGLAVFYYTLYLAFQDYQLFSQTVAFLLMAAVTGFAVLLSVAYDRQELAVLAIVGGFASPLMVSTGQGNYVVLFSYLLLLDLGMVALAFFKRWPSVNATAFGFTVLLYGSWLGMELAQGGPPSRAGALLFASLFYLLFFVMNILNNLREGQKFRPLEISLLLLNVSAFFAAGMMLMDDWVNALRGIFTVLLALFNFAFAYWLYRHERVDRNFVFFLVGVVLTLVSLAGPVQLEGNYITLFWAIEGTMLLWLGQKTGIGLFKSSSGLVVALMVLSLLLDFEKFYFTYSETALPIVANRVFLTGLFSGLSVVASLGLLRGETGDRVGIYPRQAYAVGLVLVAIGVFYSAGAFETFYQSERALELQDPSYMNLMAFTVAFLGGLGLFLGSWRHRAAFGGLVAVAIVGGLAHLLSFTYTWGSLRHVSMEQLGLGQTWGHWVGFAGFLLLAFHFLWRFDARAEASDRQKTFGLWATVALLVLALSRQYDFLVGFHLYVPQPIDPADMYYDAYEQRETFISQSRRIGYPMLWGISSFVMMLLGLRLENRQMRVISLSLFGLIVVKLFAVDVWEMSEGGRIISFITLGVILLVVSFLYQKLKKLLVETPETDSAEPLK